jgi:hypothetical protein
MGWKEEWTVEKRENLESFGSRAQDMLHCRGTHLKFDDAQAGESLTLALVTSRRGVALSAAAQCHLHLQLMHSCCGAACMLAQHLLMAQ